MLHPALLAALDDPAPAIATLDGVAAPLAAFGLCRLLTAYAGKAINVRRSSDNATQDIGFVGNDFDTATALAFANGGNLFVTKWYEQNGSGKDPLQATAANQPQITLNALNGKPLLTFTTAHSLSTSGNLTPASAVSHISLAKPTALANLWNPLWTLGANTTVGLAFYSRTDGTLGTSNNGASFIGAGYNLGQAPAAKTATLSATTDGTNHLWEGILSASQATILVDGVTSTLTVSSPLAVPSAGAPLIIGADSAGDRFAGTMGPVVIWNSEVSASDRSTVRQRLAAYYGLTVTP